MGRIKLYDIAKELNIPSKDIVDLAINLKMDVKSHLSAISEEDAEKIRNEAKKLNLKNNSNKKESKKTLENKEKESTPVIIRREVIVEDENKKIDDSEKKDENKKNEVGFVERKNKNFNIVYRNKTSKPMTFDELFGTKKEEKPVKKVEENKKDIEMKVETKTQIIKQETNPKVEIKTETKEEKKEEKKIENIETNNKINNEKTINKSFDKSENKTFDKNISNSNNNSTSNNVNNSYKPFNKVSNNNRQFADKNNNYKNQNKFNKNNGNSFYSENKNRFDNKNKFENKNHPNTGFGNSYNKKPLDKKGIEKNIKDIMAVETIEKEPMREYNKSIDKQKENNRFNEIKTNKKSNKARRNNLDGEINEHKLKGLKRTDQLSNMFEDTEGGMLDYYDLTTQRGKKGKKKANKDDENRNKQKIFKLEEITIPENITVKDFAAELKKTTAEVIKKLLNYGVMATINNEIDFDTASLIVKINMAIRKVDDRIDMHPVYFNKVCLVLGLYSVLLLLIIGDYKVHSLTNQVWPLFVLGIICYIFYLLIKEVLIFANLTTRPLKNNNLRTVFVTISLFAGSYLAAFVWNSILNQYIFLLVKFDTSNIKYISLFLPYISFVICFILYSCSILYAKFKIYTINILIRKQEKKIEQFLNNNKISGIQFN